MDYKIKICGMRNPGNIAEVAMLRPDYLGFIFYPKSKRFIQDPDAGEILSVLDGSIKKVGVFVNETVPTIIQKANLYGLDVLQIHGNESPGYCEELKSLGFTVVKAFGIDESFDFSALNDYNQHCDFYLFDTKSKNYGGTGVKFDWEILKKYDNHKPIFLSGGIGPEDAAIFQNGIDLNIHALDINSKFELEPALKDVQVLKSFMEKIRK